MAVPVQDLEEPQAGQCGLSGVATIAYVIPLSDVETVASLKAVKTTPEDYAVLVGSHAIKAGKFFMELYSEEELSAMTAESEGQKSSRFYRYGGQFMYPRNSRQAVGTGNMLKGVRMVIILKDVKTQEMFSLGNNEVPVRLVPSVNTGQAYGDESGVTFTIEGAACAMTIYEGAIPLETDIINAPITLAPDVTTIDASTGSVFNIGANTAPQAISSITNLDVGTTLRIYYVATSVDTTTITLDNSQSVVLDADGEFVEIKNTGLGLVAVDGSIS